MKIQPPIQIDIQTIKIFKRLCTRITWAKIIREVMDSVLHHNTINSKNRIINSIKMILNMKIKILDKECHMDRDKKASK